MTITFFAQPYDLSAIGFYFQSGEDFDAKAAALHNTAGQPVEEFKIQFIEGAAVDCELAEAFGLHQGGFEAYFEAAETWDHWEKLRLIIAVRECGYDFDADDPDPGAFDVDLYEKESLRDLAERFVEEGFFGDVPSSLQFYIDYLC